MRRRFGERPSFCSSRGESEISELISPSCSPAPCLSRPLGSSALEDSGELSTSMRSCLVLLRADESPGGSIAGVEKRAAWLDAG